MSRRDVGAPPSMDFAEAMSDRYATPEPVVEQSAAKPAARSRGAASEPAQTRRSWLLPKDVADDFAAAADRIHHGSGGAISKSQAQAALMRAGIEREAEVTRALLGDDAS